MAWASCYTPEYRVISLLGASAGTTAVANRRLVENIVNVGNFSFVLGTVDSARYALRMTPASTAATITLTLMQSAGRYCGAKMRCRVTSALTTNTILLRAPASTASETIGVRVATTGEIQYTFNNGTNWTGSGHSVVAGQIFRLELFADFPPSGTTNHVCKVRLDGVEIVNTTGGTAAVTMQDPTFGASTAAASMTVDMSDFVSYNDPAQYGAMDDWRVIGVEPVSLGTSSFTDNDFQDAASQNITAANIVGKNVWDYINDAPTAAPSISDCFKQVVTRTTAYIETVLRAGKVGQGDPVLVCLAAAMHPVASALSNSCAFRLNSGGNLSAETAIDTSLTSNTLEYRLHTYTTEPGGAAWTQAKVISTPLRVRFGYSGDASPPPALDAIMAFITAPAVQLSKANSNEGGSNSTDITPANSGGASGNAWDVVTADSGGTVKFSSTNPSTQTLCSLFNIPSGGRAFFRWLQDGIQVAPVYVRFNMRLDAYPNNNINLVEYIGSDSLDCAVVKLYANGTLGTNDKAGNALLQTSALPTGQWMRVEIRLVPSPVIGEIEMRVWLNGWSNGTPDYTLNSTGQVLGLDFGGMWIGQISSNTTTTWTFALDDIWVGTNWAGPTMTGPQVITLNAASETDSASTLQAQKRKAIGQISDSSTAGALTRGTGHTVALGKASETDSAAVLQPRKRGTLNQASQGNVANVLQPRKRLALGQINETDSVAILRPAHAKTIGQAMAVGGYTPDSDDITATSFENESALSEIFTGGAAGVLSFSTANPRTGARHVRAALTGAADSLVNFPAGTRVFAMRFGFYVSALPTGNSRIFTIDGPAGVSRLTFVASGAVGTNIGGTGGTTVATFSAGQYYVIDILFDCSTSTYSFAVRVNGGTQQVQTKTAQTPGDIADVDFWSTWVGTVTSDLDDLHIRKNATAYLSDMTGGSGISDTANAFTHARRWQVNQVSEADVANVLTRLVTGQTIALGQASSVDTASALIHARRATLGQASEADTSSHLAAGRRHVLGQATEADGFAALKNAVPAHRVTIGQASTADTAAVFSHKKQGHLGQASESNVANALSHSKRGALGQASTVDTAAVFTVVKGAHVVGTALEADSATQLKATHRAALNRASEADTASVLAPKRRVLTSQPSETDTATQLKAIHRVTLGQASTTDSATVFSHKKQGHLGQISTADTAGVFTLVHGAHVLGQALETDTATHATGRKTVQLGKATETDSAGVLRPTRHFALNRASEVDSATVAKPVHARTIGQASTTDSATVFGHSKRGHLNQTTENDSADSFTVVHGAYVIGQATENDSAKPITGRKTVQLGRATSTDTAGALTAQHKVALNRASEADSATTFSHSKRKQLGQATSTDTANALAHAYRVTLGKATESDTASQLRPARHGIVNRASETDAANTLHAQHRAQLNQATTTDSSRPFTAVHRITIGRATSTDTAGTARPGHRVALNIVQDSSTSRPLHVVKIYHLTRASTVEIARPFKFKGPVAYPDPSGGTTVASPVGFSTRGVAPDSGGTVGTVTDRGITKGDTNA